MENLNAEQIKKALECCKSPKLTKCDGCPREKEDGHCMYRLNEDASALIKSQEQRIEEFEAERKKWQGRIEIECEYTKSDTVRKMQERLKAEAYPFPCAIGVEYAVPYCKIDRIANELLNGEEMCNEK
jgi:hydrogenase maturation factor HypF (carbamoyltransferase family)